VCSRSDRLTERGSGAPATLLVPNPSTSTKSPPGSCKQPRRAMRRPSPDPHRPTARIHTTLSY
jgi:hypothetical protein